MYYVTDFDYKLLCSSSTEITDDEEYQVFQDDDVLEFRYVDELGYVSCASEVYAEVLREYRKGGRVGRIYILPADEAIR